MTRYDWRVLSLVLVFSCNAGLVRGADQPPAFSMSAEEFRRLSLADQHKLIAGAFERRLQHAKNIHYECLVRIQNHEYHDGKVGKLDAVLNGGRYHHWGLGDSYRTMIALGGPNVSEPSQFVDTGYDSSKGVRKSATRFTYNSRRFGRIAAKHDPVIEDDRYQYWLDGEHNGSAEFIIRYLFDHRGSYTIESPVGQEMVHLDVPWQPKWSPKPVGTRKFLLDPEKGFLPVEGKSHREHADSGGKKVVRHEEFFVEESSLVSGVWMPTKLRELVVGSSLGLDKVNVWLTDVSKIESGTVTPDDLVVSFPEGIEIVDAIEGIFYVAGPNGDRLKEQRLLGSKAMTAATLSAQGPKPSRKMFALLLVNVGIILVVSCAVLLRLRNRRRTPTLDS